MSPLLVYSLVASLGKYAFRIEYMQNPNLFILLIVVIENSCGGILEKWRKVTSAFIDHRI